MLVVKLVVGGTGSFTYKIRGLHDVDDKIKQRTKEKEGKNKMN